MLIRLVLFAWNFIQVFNILSILYSSVALPYMFIFCSIQIYFNLYIKI